MNAQVIPHAAESLHWYYPDGRPAYTVPGARGKEVTPDIRHARKLGLLPSVTSIIRIMARPALERWKAEQLALAALTLPRGAGEPDAVYLRRLAKDARAYAAQRAVEGTAVHKAIEQAYRGEPYDPRCANHVGRVQDAIRGIDGPFVGDFKTKDTFDGKEGLALFYDEHVMQLAAYRAGLSAVVLDGAVTVTPNVECETPFAYRQLGYAGRNDVRFGSPHNASLVSFMIACDTGEVRTRVWTPEEANRGWDMFYACLTLWKLKNRFWGDAGAGEDSRVVLQSNQ